MHELHAPRSQAWKRQLAAAALEIVKGNHRRGRSVALERKREIGPDETGPTGNEDAFSHDAAAMKWTLLAKPISQREKTPLPHASWI